MRKLPKWIARAGLVLLALALLVPFLVPVETSGTKNNKELALANSSFTEALGIQIHLQRTAFDCEARNNGDNCENPPVFFLLHGFGASTFSFREISDPLSAYGEVIAYDRPGFGLTDRPTSWEGENPYGSAGNDLILDQLIDSFAPNSDVYLVGHSAGGTQAAQYVVDNKDAVKGLILIAPAILSSGGFPSWLNWIFSIPQIDHLGPLLVSSIASSGMDLLSRSFVDQSKITAEVTEGYRVPLQVSGWEEGFWEFNRAPRAFDIKERLDEITIPTLLLTGDSDVVVATDDTLELASLIKGAVVFVIPAAGHLPQEEDPENTMKAIKVTWSILSR
jgi:pimeloyl-ACP methyl ester carboxylesterase